MSRHPGEQGLPAGHPAHMSAYMLPQSVCLRAEVLISQKVRATIINPELNRDEYVLSEKHVSVAAGYLLIYVCLT